MRDDGPPILFVSIWGLFAAIMLFAQSHMNSVSATMAALADAENPFPIMEMASLDPSIQSAHSISVPMLKAEPALLRIERLGR